MITAEMAHALDILEHSPISGSDLYSIIKSDELIHQLKMQGYMIYESEQVVLPSAQVCLITQSGRAALYGYKAVLAHNPKTSAQIWKEIEALEEAMDNERSHYGVSEAWRKMKSEHAILWKLVTDSDTSESNNDTLTPPAQSVNSPDAQRIRALEAENAALRKERDALKALLMPIVENARFSPSGGINLLVRDEPNAIICIHTRSEQSLSTAAVTAIIDKIADTK